MMRFMRMAIRGTALVSCALLLGATPALAEDAPASEGGAQAEGTTPNTEERLDEVESKVGVLAEELARAITSATVPEERKLESAFGLGPAASKVYHRDKGLSIGSYGEVRFRSKLDDESDDIYDALRAVLYVGYRFNDRFLINSELEFEHGGTGGGGSVSAEFINIDFFATEDIGLRGGLLLIPMGFINEIHEPNFYFGAERPEVERQIIPSTWRENGAGAFGTLGDRVHFRMYGVNGMDASGFSVSGLRGGRQKGSKALANHWAFVGRVDVDVVTGLMLGGSVYTGFSGQNQTDADSTLPIPSTLTTLYELHAEYKRHGLSVRGLFTQAFVGDAAELNAALLKDPDERIASRMLGAYGEIGYDVMPLVFPDTRMSLEPYFRYERVDTQNEMPTGSVANEQYIQDIYTVGASFKPIPEVVLKLDYRNFRPKSDPDDIANQVQFSMGYVF